MIPSLDADVNFDIAEDAVTITGLFFTRNSIEKLAAWDKYFYYLDCALALKRKITHVSP